ncbi:MAG UNVERIFIED_CONTAM: hypothetical protein LVR18_29680 [Planctomycetaceae bacterium]
MGGENGAFSSEGIDGGRLNFAATVETAVCIAEVIDDEDHYVRAGCHVFGGGSRGRVAEGESCEGEEKQRDSGCHGGSCLEA